MPTRADPLTRFGERLVSLCNAHDIEPILYGSYLLREHVSEPIDVHDIDFYVHEDDFAKLIELLSEADIKHRFDERWHTLQAFDGDLLIEFDSIDYWYEGPIELTTVPIGEKTVRALDRDSLEHVYQRATESSSEPASYEQKLALLRGARR